jgi:hypothetical protein
LKLLVELTAHSTLADTAKRRFAAAFQDELSKRRLGQKRLAHAIGVSEEHLSRQLRCVRSMDMHQAFALVQTIGADVSTARSLLELAELRIHEPCSEERDVIQSLGRDIELTELIYGDAVAHHAAHNFRAASAEEVHHEFVVARDFLERIADLGRGAMHTRIRSLPIYAHVRLWDLYKAHADDAKAQEHADVAHELQSESADADACAEALRVMGLHILRRDPSEARACFDEALSHRPRTSLSVAWWDVLAADQLRAEVRSTSRVAQDIEQRARTLSERLHAVGVHWAALRTELTLAEALAKVARGRDARSIVDGVIASMSDFPDVSTRMSEELRRRAGEIFADLHETVAPTVEDAEADEDAQAGSSS